MLVGLLAMLRFRASRTLNVRSSAVLASLRIQLSLAKLAIVFALFLNSGCAFFQPSDRFGARPVAFNALSGWENDNAAEALQAFLSSCPVLTEKTQTPTSASRLEIPQSVWQSLCTDAAQSQHAPREFFERRFVPYRVNNNGRERGLFTGYYEPVLYGARRKHGDFIYPLYLAPPDLVDKEPYYTHAEINDGALDGKKLVLLWVDDPVMRFFLQVQGSGRIKLSRHKEIQVGYAGKNNQPYVALGKIMGEEGLIPKDQINFFTIRQWLYRHPDQAIALMERNPSYVFFKIREKPGAIGALGVVLTPVRSLAVDNRYIPYGLPVFLETELPAYPQQQPTPFKRLMIAQDTGGAIKGPVRGDVFFGPGDEAEYFAGNMAQKGVYSILVPKEIAYQLDNL